jgi:PAS domain S-box-containing protein
LYIPIIDAASAISFQTEFFARNPAIDPMTRIMAQAPGSSLFVKDSESHYVRANAGTLETYGLKNEEELIGRRNRDFFPALLADAYESEDRRVVESGEPLLNEVWLVPHVRGTPRWFVSSKAPLFDTAGKIIGLVGLMHPIETPEDQREHFQELRRVMEFIDQHFVDEITVERLAEIVGISVPHFNRRFRQLLRLSPMEYVLSLRVQRAQRLLTTTNQSVGEIALATGFYDQSHFTKRFNKAVGMTPLAYRKKYRTE